jgi:hypothetical protein
MLEIGENFEDLPKIPKDILKYLKIFKIPKDI